MKATFYLLITLFLSTGVYAQENLQRRISYRTFSKDSIHLALSSDYNLIEDSCASIVRKARVLLPQKKFIGAFVDVEKDNPSKILSKGTFNNEGALDGVLISYHSNGQLRAEGNFENGSMMGAWTIFFPNGKKQLEYENTGGLKRILNSWDSSGKQIIKEGNGNHQIQVGFLIWEGKLVKGQPHGIWRSRNINNVAKTTLSEETFENGKFVKGVVSSITYKDASRINFEPHHLLEVLNAQYFQVSNTNCEGRFSNYSFKPAHFRLGNNALNAALKTKIETALYDFNLTAFNLKRFRIYGEITDKGVLTNLRYIEYVNHQKAQNLINTLTSLPNFVPATQDGKNAKSNLIFEFSVGDGGWYTYKYSFLPYKEFKSYQNQ